MTIKRLGGWRQAPMRSTMFGCRSSLQEEEEEKEVCERGGMINYI
jgi:hypothetical protein